LSDILLTTVQLLLCCDFRLMYSVT